MRPPAVLLAVTFALAAGPAAAETFKAGDAVEYKVGTSSPEKWERGTIIRELEGGKQYLVREKPSQFFPEGPEKAYAPENLRVPKDDKKPAAEKPPVEAPPGGKPAVAPPAVGTAMKKPAATAADKGLLSKEDVVAFAKETFGPGDPFKDGTQRDKNLTTLRDQIKTKGVNFVPDDAFKYKQLPNGMYSVHVGSALESNYGQHPKLDDYYGTFLLRTTNRGTKSATKDGSKVTITTTDAQFESGALVIAKDKTFTWKLGRTDPEAKWLTGKWREATADEVQPWEGGPTLVLEKARQNEDYTVRACRVPGYEGWIDVGMGKGRIAASYGRRE